MDAKGALVGWVGRNTFSFEIAGAAILTSVSETETATAYFLWQVPLMSVSVLATIRSAYLLEPLQKRTTVIVISLVFNYGYVTQFGQTQMASSATRTLSVCNHSTTALQQCIHHWK